jgi:nucleoside-diphosphate-sugar epimerase
MASCVVAGAGGFFGGHLVPTLVADGEDVPAVDTKPVDRWCHQLGSSRPTPASGSARRTQAKRSE